MTKPGGTGLVTAGLIVAGLIGVGTYMSISSQNVPSQEELTAVIAPDADAAAPQAEEPETAPAAQSAPQPDVENEETKADVAKEPAASDASITPSIEEVRLEDDGLTVIGGRAEPGAAVSVFVDGKEIATAQTDARGFFAAVAFIEPSEGARILTLQAESGGETMASTDDVILAPVARQLAQVDPAVKETSTKVEEPDALTPTLDDASPEEATEDEKLAVATANEQDDELAVPEANETVEAEPETETAQVARQAQVAPPAVDDVLALSSEVTTPAPKPTAEVAETPSEAPADGSGDLTIAAPTETPDIVVANNSPQSKEPPEEPKELVQAITAPEPVISEPANQSVAVLKSTEEGVTLLQNDAPPAVAIGIDTIGYSAEGDVELSGRATLGSFEARLYLDNRFVSSLEVDANGTWRGTVPDVDTGIYTLRVDEVNAAGDVTSRVETPFRREAPSVLAQASAGRGGLVQAITVQTGDTLWAIARERYGEGLLFVKVFEANSDAIRDPDLIYPGQVFDLPIE